MRKTKKNHKNRPDPYEDIIRLDKLDPYEALITLNVFIKENNNST